jgi:general secretion pathway protein G
VLGVLAAAVMPLGEALLLAQKERELKQALWEIRGAIDSYKLAVDRGKIRSSLGDNGYPPSLKALVSGVENAAAPSAGTVYFLRQIPRDPFADSALAPEQTWRLRSYSSPPDRPSPGEDVFDIRSSSEALAMDGTPYASW